MGIEFDTSFFVQSLNKLISEQPHKVEKLMTDIAVDIASEASDRAPVDIGSLTRCIEYDVQKDLDGTVAIIYVPNDSEAKDYAIAMHEHIYRLGSDSLRKQQKNGVRVGCKYITRAIEENRDYIRDMIINRLKF